MMLSLQEKIDIHQGRKAKMNVTCNLELINLYVYRN